jgi:hypothetical protein
MMSIVLPALGRGSGAASCTRRRRQWRRATCESPTTGSARTLAVSLSGSTRCQSGPQIEYHKGSNHHGTSGSPENNGYCGIGGSAGGATEIATSHDAMVMAPEELTRMLIGVTS